MDPLNLLKELYGEEPIRKILNSGFDSPGKIAAATAESLSFFAGVQEALARQIIESAEAAIAQPPEAGERREAAAAAPSRPIQPRELPRAAAPAASTKKSEPPRSRAAKSEPLDERPILDAGGVLKSLAREPNPKELMRDSDFLEEVGLTDAEAGFLEGLSPWPGAAKERTSPAPAGPREVSGLPVAHSEPLEFAPISSWSPEEDPDPVPRLVRAPELGPDPSPAEPPSSPGALPPSGNSASEEQPFRETDPMHAMLDADALSRSGKISPASRLGSETFSSPDSAAPGAQLESSASPRRNLDSVIASLVDDAFSRPGKLYPAARPEGDPPSRPEIVPPIAKLESVPAYHPGTAPSDSRLASDLSSLPGVVPSIASLESEHPSRPEEARTASPHEGEPRQATPEAKAPEASRGVESRSKSAPTRPSFWKFGR